jgi:hypothetical protein
MKPSYAPVSSLTFFRPVKLTSDWPEREDRFDDRARLAAGEPFARLGARDGRDENVRFVRRPDDRSVRTDDEEAHALVAALPEIVLDGTQEAPLDGRPVEVHRHHAQDFAVEGADSVRDPHPKSAPRIVFDGADVRAPGRIHGVREPGLTRRARGLRVAEHVAVGVHEVALRVEDEGAERHPGPRDGIPQHGSNRLGVAHVERRHGQLRVLAERLDLERPLEDRPVEPVRRLVGDERSGLPELCLERTPRVVRGDDRRDRQRYDRHREEQHDQLGAKASGQREVFHRSVVLVTSRLTRRFCPAGGAGQSCIL